MSTKVLKYISVCVLVLAFGVFGTAQAAVTVGTTSVTSNGALTLTGATASTWTTTAGALTLTSAAAATWSTSAGALTLTGTGGLTLDSGTTTAVNLGTAAAAKTITIGNAASTLLDLDAISIDIDGAGTGVTIDALDAGTLNIGTSAVAASDTSAINIGTSATARTITVGAAESTLVDINGISIDIDGAGTGVTIDALDAGTLNIGTSAVAASDTSAINIGTSATARTITVGAAESTIVDINAISVDIDGAATGVTIDALDAGSINLGTSADAASDTSAVNVGTSATARTITVGNAASTEAEINALLIDINGGATGITVDSAGAISLDAAAASNFTTTGAGIDITIDATAGSVVVDSGEAAADALLLQATGGTTATAHLTSNGTGASAIDIDATGVGGGIDIDAGTGGINVATTSTTANAINVIASGIVAGTALNLDTTDGGIELDANGADNGDIIINAADVLDIDSADALSINSSAGVINIGNDAVSQNISIGTAGTRTIAIGSATTKINATAADDSLVNLSAATNTTTAVVNKGLIIPISADCALGITEGQICWDSDNNVLYVGDAAAAVAVAGSTGAANTWTDNQIYTLLGDEDIAITSDLGAAANIISITATPNAADFAVQGIKIDQAASANANGLDAAIEIDNSDDTAAITAGLLFTSAGGAITTAINASATQIGTALQVDANDIVGTTGLINYTNFDVDAAGKITTADDVVLSSGKITVDTVLDETSYVKRNQATTATPVFEIEATATGDTNPALLIDHNGTGNAMGLQITHDGDLAALDITAGAARTGNVINIPMADQLAQTALDITGAATGTSGEGIIHVDVTGVLAGNAIRVDSTGANATTGQLIYATSSGTQAGATNGIAGYFTDTGALAATSYTVYISSTNNEGLYVDAGLVVFDESLTVGGDLTLTGGDIDASGEASTYTIIDNAANAFVLESVTDGLDYFNFTTTNGSETMTFGHSTVDSITFTTDDTGDGTDVVLPAGSIDTTEILDGTIVAADVNDAMCLQVVGGEFNPTETGATDDYLNLIDNSFSATETDEDMFIVPTAVKIDNLRVEVATAPGAGNDTWVITVRDDAAGSTLTCSIDEAATSCNDAVAAATVAANSKLAVQVTSNSEGAPADPTASASMTVSFCITQ